ncbi:MAG TPA: oligosaccharide flippase family protein [Patescibacteria group bacterium]|nr:oligosaccharide flippase family protein [Patescibacteria group bacterium]
MRRPGTGAALPEPGAGERRVAARSVAWGGIESATSAAVGLLLTPLVLRVAGLEGLGLWGAAWSLAHTAGLVDLGIGASYTRFTARALASDDARELNETVSLGVAFHLTLAAAIALPAMLLGPRLLERVAPGSPRLPEARVVLACTLATVLLRGVLSVYRGVVAGAQRTDLLARIGSAASLIEGAGGAMALALGAGLRGMAINSLLVAVGTSAAEAWAAHHLCRALRVRPFVVRRRRGLSLLAFGSRVQVTRAFEILGTHAPRLVLAAGPGLAAAGAYDLAARLAGVVGLGAALPLRVILPLAGHLDARGERRRLETLLEHSSRYVALLAMLPATAILVSAGALLVAWTGRAAPPECAATVRLLAPAAAIAFSAAPLRLLVRGLGRAGIEALSTAAGTGMQLALLVPAAARAGALGAGGAALAGSVVSALTLAALVARAPVGVDPGVAARAVARVLLGAVCATAAGIGLAIVLPASAASGRTPALALLCPRLAALTVVFAAAAWFTGAFRSDDLAVVRDAFLPARAALRPAPSGAPPGTAS